MKPIDFYVFPRSEVARIAPLSASFLSEWEAVRPGVLDDNSIDVFLPNIRSERHPTTRFDLFQRVENVDSGTVIVCSSWLELLEADGVRHHITNLMNTIRSLYPFNPKVWTWNNDRDQATVPELQGLPENEFVLAYNTSRPSPQDILLPFWTIECRHKWSPQADREFRGGFIGYVGGVKLRQTIKRAFDKRDGWVFTDTTEGAMPQETYLNFMHEMDFALCPRGGGLSSYRFYEALQCGCIPILFADDVALPYPDLDWHSLIYRIKEEAAGNFDLIWDVIGNVNVKLRRKMLTEVRERFTLAGVHRTIHAKLSEYLS